MIENIRDRRERPHRWKRINAIVEPTWHDNNDSDPDRDQSELTADEIVYAERESISLSEAIAWASSLPGRVTLYLYDDGRGTAPVMSIRELEAENYRERKTPMAWQQLLYKVEDRVATITLNRPDRLNAYTQVMAGELREAFAAADADDDVRAIVLTGAGRGFCAGADMERLSAAVSGAADLKPGASYPTEGLAANFAQSCSYILGLKKPVIAGINGPVAGIGLVITLFCDIRYMAAGAKLTTAFARRGLIAEHGISWMLPRLIGPMNAMDLLLSARAVTAEEADDLGLVRVLPADGFAGAVQARAAEIANLSSPRSTRIIKRQVYEALFQSLAEASAIAYREQEASGHTEDFREGVAHWVEKRAPRFTGR